MLPYTMEHGDTVEINVERLRRLSLNGIESKYVNLDGAKSTAGYICGGNDEWLACDNANRSDHINFNKSGRVDDYTEENYIRTSGGCHHNKGAR